MGQHNPWTTLYWTSRFSAGCAAGARVWTGPLLPVQAAQSGGRRVLLWLPGHTDHAACNNGPRLRTAFAQEGEFYGVPCPDEVAPTAAVDMHKAAGRSVNSTVYLVTSRQAGRGRVSQRGRVTKWLPAFVA